ncbi:MAG: hypothetical protein ABUK01_11355 [Leptospirales bacterium]
MAKQIEIKEHDLKEKKQDHVLGLQKVITYSTIVLFAASMTATFVIIFGIALWEFKLPKSFLNWMGGATIGQIGGLMAIVYKGVFRSTP